jgi:TonB-dependent starch-binding outer membrane protein SusC
VFVSFLSQYTYFFPRKRFRNCLQFVKGFNNNLIQNKGSKFRVPNQKTKYMNVRLLARRLKYAAILIVLPFLVNAQQKTVTGKVTSDKDGSPISGATVLAKGSTKGTQTAADGAFVLEVPAATKTLVVSAVGSVTEQVTIGADNTANVSLKVGNEGLTEVVVIGYGTARKKDLTGAVGTVSAKNFNKGPVGAPDQLIQGKLAGVQVISNNGAPGGGTTIRIRGNSSLRGGNTPLFVIDGVPLSNNNSRPDIGLTGDIGGGTPSGNPLNFINPNDIASMDVLKDASAAAIYGSRGANGVVLITTKKGQAGGIKVDFTTSIGTSSILKKLKVLNSSEYITALGQAGLATTVNTPTVSTTNYGSSADALGDILRKGSSQNYSVGISSGNENAKYRLSLGYLNQKGIIQKSDYSKYTANLTSTVKMLDSKKLTVDFGVLSSQTVEHIVPISNNAGAKGSLIGQALRWNPTRSLYNADGSPFVEYGSDLINPVAYNGAYNDMARVSTILASVSPSYKITDNLEFKTLMSVNYSSGIRKQYTTAFININGIAIDTRPTINTPPVTNPDYLKGGDASVSQNELVTKQITNTLSYNNNISKSISLNAVLGHEYIKTDFGGNGQSATRLLPTDKPYYYYLSSALAGNRQIGGFQDPTTELQSFFARAIFNISDKYVISGVIRADGSSKFGKNNRYGTFPSISAAWNLSKENFMKNITQISNAKIRASYGLTGNQDFPSGASQLLYTLSGNPGNFSQSQFFNPDLKWEQTKTLNVGLDFGLLGGNINASVDYFKKNTTNLLFPRGAADPVTPNSAVKWENLPNANIVNTGLELSLNATIINKNDFTLGVSANITFLKNNLLDYIGTLETGEVNGQGLSGAFSQLIKADNPINTFYLKKFTGIDKTSGISTYEGGDQKFLLGSANPNKLVGFTINAAYKKLTLEVSMNGSMGQYIYNNTDNAELSYNNIVTNKNLSKRNYDYAVANGEKFVNPTSASSRYLEKGDYLKLSNMTIGYNLGQLGKVIKSSNVFLTAQNLFIITKYSGFDPEINTSKPLNGIPSFGLEYSPYPSARSFNLGFNFSL